MQASDVIGIAIKKINSVVSGVASVVVDDTAKTITWTFTDGNTATMHFDQPSDGVSVVGFTQIDTTHFVWDYSDGTQSTQFEIPEQYIAISAESGNALVKKADGLYVSTSGVEISAATGNKIETKADGLFVGADANKVDVDQTVANAGKALIVGADGMVTVGDAGVKVSTKDDNLIETVTETGKEGIYVGHDTTKIDKDQGISEAGKALIVGADGNVTTGDAGVKVSTKTGNDIEEITTVGEEGIFVEVPVKSVKVDGTALTPDAQGAVDITISAESGNILETKTDGLFVPSEPTKISTKDGNDIENITETGKEGIYANVPVKVVKVNGNALTVDATDDSVDVKIDADSDNIISYGADGFIAKHKADETDNMTYDVLFDPTATETTPYHGDADKEATSDYLYKQFQIVIPVLMDKIKSVFDLASNIEYATYNTYADLELVDQTAITDKIMVYMVKQDENYPRVDGAADYYSTIYLMIPKTNPLLNAVEFVAKLNMSEKLLEYAITEAIKRAIYIPIPEHYELTTAGETGALEVVADSDPLSDGQIHLSNVTPVLPTGTVVNVGDYVLHKDQTHSTVTKFVKRDEIDVSTVAKFAENAEGTLEYNGSPLAVATAVYLSQAEYDALPDTKLTDGKDYYIS